MQKLVPIVVAGVALIGVGVSATPALALSTTTFVSGFGLDTNPCTVAAPCRSFQHAHDVTAAGGQITMLDPAGYGAVTISKAISIVNDGGGEAGITDPGASADAIVINAGASDIVNLRGLTLNGVGTGRNGIAFNSGGALNIQNCVIRAFSNDGVLAGLGATAAVTIFDTIVSDNAIGIEITATGGGVTVIAALARVATIGNQDGFFLQADPGNTLRAAIVDSVATGSSIGNGVQVHNPGTVVTLVNSRAINNHVGLEVDLGATLYISGTTVAGSQTDGFINNGGKLQTFGDNYIIDTTNSGSLTPIAEQ